MCNITDQNLTRQTLDTDGTETKPPAAATVATAFIRMQATFRMLFLVLLFFGTICCTSAEKTADY